jgi:hypothetical protein
VWDKSHEVNEFAGSIFVGIASFVFMVFAPLNRRRIADAFRLVCDSLADECVNQSLIGSSRLSVLSALKHGSSA